MTNNFKAFELMILSTTLLGNENSSQWQKDATLILDFVGRAFALEQMTLEEAKKSVLIAAQTIQTKEDAGITLITELDDFEVSSFEFLKGKTVLFLQSLFSRNELYFTDYRHVNPYFPKLHFHNTSALAKTGYLLAVRHLALLYYLGIGVNKNVARAEKLLWNSAFWGDEQSLYLLKEIANESKREQDYNNLRDLIILAEEGLYSGTTEIKDGVKYAVWVQEHYKLISTIYHDIILAETNNPFANHVINASFVEVMQLPKLSYEKKMQYINEYAAGKWKNETNKIFTNAQNIGFVKGDKK